jgi:hypothetical protein
LCRSEALCWLPAGRKINGDVWWRFLNKVAADAVAGDPGLVDTAIKQMLAQNI